MFLIRIYSFLSFLTENAIANETDNGRPSGIATIIITIAIMAMLAALSKVWFEMRSISVKRTKRVMKNNCESTLKITTMTAYLLIY
jgi:hypothetical protein